MTIRPAFWLLAGALALLLGMSGCAGTPGASGSENASLPAEPVTESDEPEVRKRARLRTELAAGYFEQGQTTVALDEIKQALNADPTYQPAYNLRGLVYMQLNELALAENSFQRALQLNPRDGDAMHNMGWLWCQQGRHAQAVAQFRQALAVPNYPNTARTWMVMGVCQVRAGQTTEAEQSFLRSFELDAGHPVPMYNLARLLFQRGEAARAQFYAQRLNASSTLSNAETLWLGIRIERALGNRDNLRLLAEQLRQRHPQSREWGLYTRGAFDE